VKRATLELALSRWAPGGEGECRVNFGAHLFPFILPHTHGASGLARGQTKTHARGMAAHVQAATWIAERARRVRVRRAGGLLIGASEATVNAIGNRFCALRLYSVLFHPRFAVGSLMKSKSAVRHANSLMVLFETLSQLSMRQKTFR
jgi:hypothetical protein